MTTEFAFTDENIEKMFGKEAAEDEDFSALQSYYIKSSTHQQVTSDTKLRILVGHKGVGKSAIFTMARKEETSKNKISILIRPDDISSLAKGQSFDEMIRSWKSGLKNIIQEKIIEDILDETFDETISRKIGKSLIRWLDNFLSSKDLSEDNSISKTINNFLNDKKIYIYIDDLDRGWQSSGEDIRRISALLNAVRDLANEDEGLRFRISLRTDVYYLVRTSDESTDKIESSVIWHKWENHDILLMLVKRILTFKGNDVPISTLKELEQSQLANYLNDFFEERFNGYGKWHNAPIHKILMSLIRKRPRDMVKLCTLAARDAYEKGFSKIRTENWKNIFDRYSQDRLVDTEIEYRSELPEINKLLLGMKPTRKEKQEGRGFLYSKAELESKIKNILSNNKLKFSNGKYATADELMLFLYKINFLTARKTLPDGKISRKFFEEQRFVMANQNIDFGYEYEVHAAYRWALEPDKIIDLLSELDN